MGELDEGVTAAAGVEKVDPSKLLSAIERVLELLVVTVSSSPITSQLETVAHEIPVPKKYSPEDWLDDGEIIHC